jgi:hypothetical protein
MADYPGTGLILTYGTAGPAMNILSATASEMSVPVLDTTHMLTTGSRTKTTGDLVDEGETTFEVFFDRDLADAAKTSLGVSQVITIEHKLRAAEITEAKVTGTGAVTSWSWTATLEEMMTATIVITWLGATTHTDAA